MRSIIGKVPAGVDIDDEESKMAASQGELAGAVSPADLQEAARRHLWLHFTRMSYFDDHPVPVIVRGENCHVWDDRGKRYFDGISGLFVVQAGHGRRELAEAAADQAATLGYYPLWNYAHPAGIRLAERLAALAPGDLNRVFFTTGGSEAVETALKLARLYFKTTRKPLRHKVISRNLAYHGATMGALSVTGLPPVREMFSPLVPGAHKVATVNRYRCDECALLEGCTLHCADDIERMVQYEGPDTVAAVILEPVQNSGGCFPAPPGYFQRVREICDRYGVLLISDEVICGFGRLGHTFGCQRFDFVPDMITCAKGLTSGYSPIGAMICRDHLVEPFLRGEDTFQHGYTFGGHPVSSAVALANLDLFDREDLLGNVLRHEGDLRASLESLRDLPIVGDVRGAGYQVAIELVKDQSTRESFTEEECERVLRQYLSEALAEAGLICRSDDPDPVIQLAPPLTSGPSEFAEMTDILRSVLSETWARL